MHEAKLHCNIDVFEEMFRGGLSVVSWYETSDGVTLFGIVLTKSPALRSALGPEGNSMRVRLLTLALSVAMTLGMPSAPNRTRINNQADGLNFAPQFRVLLAEP